MANGMEPDLHLEGMARAVAAVVPLVAAPGPGSLFENPTWWDLTCVENAG